MEVPRTTGAIVTSDGHILVHQTIPTMPQRGAEPVAQDVYELARRLLDRSSVESLEPLGIGISLCELVGSSGDILSDATIKWREMDIPRLFSSPAGADDARS